MRDILERIEKLFRAMEREYSTVAGHYSFTCSGCADNCCTQRFFHYTLAEYVFLREGLRAAAPEARRAFIRRAREVVSQYEEETKEGRLRQLMCPLNEAGLCMIYAHRPMICRLHGLPHRFSAPDGRAESSGGCELFDKAHPDLDQRLCRSIDRTPFYTKLARIEASLRQRLKQPPGRLRMTTAEMIVRMAEEEPALEE